MSYYTVPMNLVHQWSTLQAMNYIFQSTSAIYNCVEFRCCLLFLDVYFHFVSLRITFDLHFEEYKSQVIVCQLLKHLYFHCQFLISGVIINLELDSNKQLIIINISRVLNLFAEVAFHCDY